MLGAVPVWYYGQDFIMTVQSKTLAKATQYLLVVVCTQMTMRQPAIILCILHLTNAQILIQKD